MAVARCFGIAPMVDFFKVIFNLAIFVPPLAENLSNCLAALSGDFFRSVKTLQTLDGSSDNIVLITDRGYETIRNLEMYIDKGQPMIMSTKVGQKHVKKRIEAFGSFDHHPEEMTIDPETRIYYKQYDLEEKIEILRLVEKGDLSVPQIADLKNINQYTIQNWIRDKRRILTVYSSQEQRSMNDDLSISSGEEAESVGTADNKDTKQHIRDLKDENEFLKAKVAYLEALMELNGTPASGFKKKSSTRPSIESSKKESET